MARPLQFLQRAELLVCAKCLRPALSGVVVSFPHTTAPVVGRSHLGGRPMIAFNECPEAPVASSQEGFLLMLPQIEKLLRRHFCRFDADFRGELIEEGV